MAQQRRRSCNINCGLSKDIDTWRRFLALCRERGTTASAEIRAFIYRYLRNNSPRKRKPSQVSIRRYRPRR